MKKIVTTLAVIVAFILSVLIVYTMNGRDQRQTEITNATVAAMESAMKSLIDKEGYAPTSNEDLETAFLSALLEEMDAVNLGYTVNVLNADAHDGIIRAEIVVNYTHPNGDTGIVAVERTMVIEDFQIPIPEKYPIIFIVGEETYRQYYLEAGQNVKAPTIPADTAGTTWITGDGMVLAPGGSMEIQGAMTFVLQ